MVTKELYTPAQAARAIGIHPKSIFRWLKSGKIDFNRVAGQRLIPGSEVERLKREAS